ncbi:Reverse transcriptase zinc-binding domain [Thalictrum thalictroides]|uniref:Reverse transcriptase zinc-binding domain n=1 Tax=Thalictrum thalictroides TaxID=46969 RepID=A0A7J6VYK6_THATH|nr:Reverse transcriptase zinc-binding domain [Thalictrum thalictroides]
MERSPDDVAIPFPSRLVWGVKVPSKCKMLFWCTLLNRILTKDNLMHRGFQVDLASSRLMDESISHVFLHCPLALQLWHELLHPRMHCFSLILTADSVEELLIAWPKGRGLHLGKRLWSLLPYSVIWILWRVRNERIFRARMVSMERMVVEVKATLWFWVGYWPGRRFYCFQDLLLRWFELLNGLLVRNVMNVGIA